MSDSETLGASRTSEDEVERFSDMNEETENRGNYDHDHDRDFETHEKFKWALTDMLRQMMFVSGETAEPAIEATTLIEEITRQQVIEIVSLRSPPSSSFHF